MYLFFQVVFAFMALCVCVCLFMIVTVFIIYAGESAGCTQRAKFNFTHHWAIVGPAVCLSVSEVRGLYTTQTFRSSNTSPQRVENEECR